MTELVKREGAETALVHEPTHQAQRTYVPRVDIVETDNELRLYADMPGVQPEDLDVRFENGLLVIHGKVQPRHKDVQYLYAEYGVGDYHREFAIHEDIDANRISAEYHNGVLVVTLPKSEEVKPKRIQVKAT